MTSNDAMLMLLAMVATLLTCTMFALKQPMLGFPSAIFWMILGADAYITSTTPWTDIYYYVFFASSVGMTIFTAFAAFGLREKHDALGDEEDEGGIVDHSSDDDSLTKYQTRREEIKQETDAHRKAVDSMFSMEEEPVASSTASKRIRELRQRAAARRTGK